MSASIALGACQGCRATAGEGKGSAQASASSPSASVDVPTARIYLMSDLAGALEPCGCTKDQLGGLNHAAAWMRAQRAIAPNSVLVSAGPLFFMDEFVKSDHRDQDLAKARTIAESLKTLGLAAFAPGANEWAEGGEALAKLIAASGAPMLVADVADAGATEPATPGWRLVETGGLRLGFVGVTAADKVDGASVPFTTTPPPEAISKGIQALKASGAQAFVALAAIGRGEAKRLADVVPELTAIVVGAPGGSGDLNAPAPPPERIGDVLVLQTGNHLTTVGALDLYVRAGSTAFADATGLGQGQRREELARRIDDLRSRIAVWEKDPQIRAEDLAARRAEVARLERERASLDAHPAPPSGSYFRYESQEIRPSLGTDPEVEKATVAYYKEVNDHNRAAFADRLPPAPVPGQPVFVGVDACTKCHKEAREVWDGTRHARAYATLADQNKQFNLDCVSCHVTGYEQPGGSSVTHVDRLTSVQCEVCHGPGSAHAADPKRVKTLLAKPGGDSCLSCHHPPHVEGFDAEKKMADILGPGHGL